MRNRPDTLCCDLLRILALAMLGVALTSASALAQPYPDAPPTAGPMPAGPMPAGPSAQPMAGDEQMTVQAGPMPELAPPAKAVCLMGRPAAQCQSSPILEIGIGPWTTTEDVFFINMDVGWLVNNGERHAVGATIGTLCNQECGLALKARYRHYLGSYMSFDLSPGLYVGATRGYSLEGAVQFSDMFAVTTGVTSTSRSDGFESGRMMYIGFRVGLPIILLALAQ